MNPQNSDPKRWATLLSDRERTGGLGVRRVSAPNQIRWRVRLAKSVRSAPVLGGDLLYVTCLDGFLHAIDTRTGRHAWKFDTGNEVHSTPSLAGNKVLFGSGSGSVYALERSPRRFDW